MYLYLPHGDRLYGHRAASVLLISYRTETVLCLTWAARCPSGAVRLVHKRRTT